MQLQISLPRKGPTLPKRKHPFHPSVRKASLARLATPKSKDIGWLPDRPSVYWLDYLIDPTPHMIMDPEELAVYYDKFEPIYPRTRKLAMPKKYYGTLYRDEALENSMSRHSGIRLTALKYTPSKRIENLAVPKPTSDYEDAPEVTSSKRSLPIPSGFHQRSQNKTVPRSRSNDALAKGDFASRRKYKPMYSRNKNKSQPSEKRDTNSRSPSRNNKNLGGGGDANKPPGRTNRSPSSTRKKPWV